jgi:hypothetical protein
MMDDEQRLRVGRAAARWGGALALGDGVRQRISAGAL